MLDKIKREIKDSIDFMQANENLSINVYMNIKEDDFELIYDHCDHYYPATTGNKFRNKSETTLKEYSAFILDPSKKGSICITSEEI